MSEREEGFRQDVLTFRALAILGVTVAEATMTQMGVNDGLIAEKRRYEILRDVYEGIVALAQRLGSWEEALTSVRDVSEMSQTDDFTDQACVLLRWQTNHLYA